MKIVFRFLLLLPAAALAACNPDGTELCCDSVVETNANSHLPIAPFQTVANMDQIKNHAKLLAECMPALSFAAGEAAAHSWTNGTNVIQGIFIGRDGDHLRNFYYVGVSNEWFATNWKPHLDRNKAIVMWSSCYSETLLAHCGGRWRTGYYFPTYMYEANDVNTAFLGRMNGRLDGTVRRTAGESYAAKDYTRLNSRWRFRAQTRRGIRDARKGSFSIAGNNWTTLCPAPTLANSVFPDATVPQGEKRFGCVLFDTFLDATIDPNQALTEIPRGAVGSYFWLKQNSEEPPYGIGFHVDKSTPIATLTVNADLIKNVGNGGGRAMDGDRKEPNNDSITWSF